MLTGKQLFSFAVKARDTDGRDVIGGISTILTMKLITCLTGCLHGRCELGVHSCKCDQFWNGTLCDQCKAIKIPVKQFVFMYRGNLTIACYPKERTAVLNRKK